MRPKLQFYLLSWVTLLVFPIIGAGLLYFFGNYSMDELFHVLELDRMFTPLTLVGIEFGFFYGFLVILISQAPLFERLSDSQTKIIKQLNLTFGDVLFISLCAGIGEELLFRASIQQGLGPWITTLLFIAVHGYFSFKNWKKNALALVLFPFILIIAFAYETLGLWFCIGAHFSYDLLMFLAVLNQPKDAVSTDF